MIDASHPPRRPLGEDRAHYLLRFDDICPTMNWDVWERIEACLDRHGVRPILAVVPDNRDPKLVVAPPCPDFWDRVRGWQAKGYAIALHGYQHVYVNRNPGIMHITPQSEFAGLPVREQEEKLRKGLEIFAAQGVRADAWVAPSHSFDRHTITLLRDLGLRTISDGLWRWPFTDRHGITWVPQQLWAFQRQNPGLWTVCHHHNRWSDERTASFCASVEDFAADITDLSSVVEIFGERPQTLHNRWIGFYRLRWKTQFKGFVKDCQLFLTGQQEVSE